MTDRQRRQDGGREVAGDTVWNVEVRRRDLHRDAALPHRQQCEQILVVTRIGQRVIDDRPRQLTGVQILRTGQQLRDLKRGLCQRGELGAV